MRVAIIGAGMAGLACGEALQRHGFEVVLFDKGRRPGGRMSTKSLATAGGDACFDYGAPYMWAREPTFRAQIEDWRRVGIVALWPAAGPDAWVGVPGMGAPVIDMAGRLDVRWSTRVTSLAHEDRCWLLCGEGTDLGCFDTVVVAIPADLVEGIVGGHDAGMATLAAATPSQPCWTVMAAFAEPLPIQVDVIEDQGDIACAARNSAKPGRSGLEAWVIHAAPEWSAEHLEKDGISIIAGLFVAFAEVIGSSLPKSLASSAHRWRYARSRPAEVRCLWNRDRGIGLCGDWCIGAKVEAAWLSGRALADEIIAAQR